MATQPKLTQTIPSRGPKSRPVFRQANHNPPPTADKMARVRAKAARPFQSPPANAMTMGGSRNTASIAKICPITLPIIL